MQKTAATKNDYKLLHNRFILFVMWYEGCKETQGFSVLCNNKLPVHLMALKMGKSAALYYIMFVTIFAVI
jgi:hypothetical protein